MKALLLWILPMFILACATKPKAGRFPSASSSLYDLELRSNFGPDVGSTVSLGERMRYLGVSAVSIAVIDGGKLSWAQSLGTMEENGAPVTTDTLFQAASISKAVTSFATLAFIGQGRKTKRGGVLQLDEDVSTYLNEDWRPAEKVTLRQLLSHSAGFNEGHFDGYLPGSPFPTLLQSLKGEAPATNEAVTLEAPPGSRWNYSGNGYLVVRKVIEDSFGDFASELAPVLSALGMSSSTFHRPATSRLLDRAARGLELGHVLPEKWWANPELSEGGLWSTPTDIAKFDLEIQKALRGKSALLPQAAAEQMVTPVISLPGDSGAMGLGLFLYGKGDDLHFVHEGANKGFRAYMIGYPKQGKGAVVMVNGCDEARYLIMEIVSRLSEIYSWPGYSGPKAKLTGKPTVDPRELAGTYRTGKFNLRIRADNGRLVLDVPGTRPLSGFAAWLMPQPGKADAFFLPMQDDDSTVEFKRDDRGRVTHATFRLFGMAPADGIRIPD